MDLENYKYNLSRLKKCNQYWDEMKPVTGGRLCSKCDKRIVDFSNMSFTDIAFYMAESKEPVCGFYLPEQLKQSKSSKTKLPLAIGLTTLLTTSTTSKAEKIHEYAEQNIVERKSIQDRESETSLPDNNKKIDTIYLVGKVLSFDSTRKMNLPLSNAAVIIKGTKTGVLAMDNGAFKLPYLPPPNSSKVYLVITAIGFEPKEIEVIYTGYTQTELGEIILDKYERELTEFWVTTKKRSAFNRLWRKITKPLR